MLICDVYEWVLLSRNSFESQEMIGFAKCVCVLCSRNREHEFLFAQNCLTTYLTVWKVNEWKQGKPTLCDLISLCINSLTFQQTKIKYNNLNVYQNVLLIAPHAQIGFYNWICRYRLFLSAQSSQTQEEETGNPEQNNNESIVNIRICDWHSFR